VRTVKKGGGRTNPGDVSLTLTFGFTSEGRGGGKAGLQSLGREKRGGGTTALPLMSHSMVGGKG